MSDDEDSDKEGDAEDERDRVAHEIFDGDDADEEAVEKSPRPPAERDEEGGEFGDLDASGEESGTKLVLKISPSMRTLLNFAAGSPFIC